MRIFPNQLASQLSKLKPIYLVFGDDPWLIDNCKQQIIDAARSQGFDERILLNTQDSNFQWQQLEQEFQAMSLFATKRIIELQLPNAKPGTEGANCLQNLIAQGHLDTILLLTGGKLGLEQTKSKWFKTLDSSGIYLPCTTPEGLQFQRWLDDRIARLKLKLTVDAKSMLVSLYEGNLLAADQALKLLKLLETGEPLSANTIAQYFEDQSRFSVFQLTDSLLSNQHTRSQHMLLQLKTEGTAMTIILWSLFKELTTLLTLKSAQTQGDNLAPLWSKMRIWDKRKPFYQSALNRLTLEQIEYILSCLSKLELNLKQHGIEDWTALSHLCLLFDSDAHSKLAHIEFELI